MEFSKITTITVKTARKLVTVNTSLLILLKKLFSLVCIDS